MVKTLNHKNLTTNTQTNFNNNLQASEVYLRNNKLPHQQQTTFVKIGNDYEAIKNEFSLSQIKNQKDVQKLFEISMSQQQNGYVRIKPLNQNMWVYQNEQDYLPISKGAIVNLAGEDNNQMMIQPCQCKGSIGNIHFKCMKRWIDTKIKDQIDMKNQVIDMDIFRCDICKDRVQS
eukprot:403342288